jgi:hypothetical protein
MKTSDLIAIDRGAILAKRAAGEEAARKAIEDECSEELIAIKEISKAISASFGDEANFSIDDVDLSIGYAGAFVFAPECAKMDVAMRRERGTEGEWRVKKIRVIVSCGRPRVEKGGVYIPTGWEETSLPDEALGLASLSMQGILADVKMFLLGHEEGGD